jgi:ankyrin repeat protein
MRKYRIISVFLLCTVSLFGQDLISIAAKGTPEQIQAAIDSGAKVNDHNEFGSTALMLAAWYNENPEVITILLKAGAKVDTRDEKGETALMKAAALNQNPDIVTILLNAGVDVNAHDKNGWTALMQEPQSYSDS